jgi:hypothetical protein
MAGLAESTLVWSLALPRSSESILYTTLLVGYEL